MSAIDEEPRRPQNGREYSRAEIILRWVVIAALVCSPLAMAQVDFTSDRWWDITRPFAQAYSRAQCADAGGRLWVAEQKEDLSSWIEVEGVDGGAVDIVGPYVLTEDGTLYELCRCDGALVARRMTGIEGVRGIAVGRAIFGSFNDGFGYALLRDGSIVTFDGDGVIGKIHGPSSFTSISFLTCRLFAIDSRGDVWRIPLTGGAERDDVTAGEPRRVQGLTGLSSIAPGFAEPETDSDDDNHRQYYPWVMGQRMNGAVVTWQDDPLFSEGDIANPVVVDGLDNVTDLRAFYHSYRPHDGHFSEELGVAIGGSGQLTYIRIEDGVTRLEEDSSVPVPVSSLGPINEDYPRDDVTFDAAGRVWQRKWRAIEPTWESWDYVSGVTYVREQNSGYIIICGNP